jgi:hypothetical protein
MIYRSYWSIMIDRMIYHDWLDNLSILLIDRMNNQSYGSIMIDQMIYRSYWSIMINQIIYHDWSDDLTILLIYHGRSDDLLILLNFHDWSDDLSILLIYHDWSDDLSWSIEWFTMIDRMMYISYWSIGPINLSWLIWWSTMIDHSINRMIYPSYWFYWSYDHVMIDHTLDRSYNCVKFDWSDVPVTIDRTDALGWIRYLIKPSLVSSLIDHLILLRSIRHPIVGVFVTGGGRKK